MYIIAMRCVDGTKTRCPLDNIKGFIAIREQAAGKNNLGRSPEDLECCGLIHAMIDVRYELEQNDRTNCWRLVVHDQLTTGQGDAKAGIKNTELLPSLTIAMVLSHVIRWYLQVSTKALQRTSRKPRYYQMWKSSAVVRWVQRRSRGCGITG